jgi:hypothetical protein
MRKFKHKIIFALRRINNKLEQLGKAAAYAIHR